MKKISLFLAIVGLMASSMAATTQDTPPEKRAPAPAKQDAEAAPNVYESPTSPVATGELDRIVFAKLDSMGIRPVLCSDSVFVRRAYLDITGTIPTARQARQFIENPNTKNKRRALVERLLETEAFADYWSMKWGDALRIKAEFPINLWPNAAQAYHRWVRSSIVANKPYDQFAREMLTSSGSNFRVGPVNFYRAMQNKTPEGIATAVALTFMGSRAESWPAERLSGMAVFFSQVGYKPTSEWKEETVFWDPLRAAALPGSVAPGRATVTTLIEPPKKEVDEDADSNDTAKDEDQRAAPAAPSRLVAMFPDGTQVELPADRDPREVFAEWLIRPDNPWFTRSIANRTWAWVMGRGIIDPADDIRDDNPPSNPELLAYLEQELVDSKYDVQHLLRLILTSTTYQLSSATQHDHAEAEANFASYPLRRLEAEVLIDAVNKITGTTDLYTSAIPEPFTYIPKNQPAVALADGSITSKFLALFGRSARATGMDDERSNKINSSQWLHMLNSSHIQTKLEKSPKLKALYTSGQGADKILDELYLTILSRPPTADEVATAKAYWAAKKTRYDFIDITWALINSTEFLYRH